MKLSPIKKTHILRGARKIQAEGVPKDYLYNNYWIVIAGNEFPFTYLTRIAYQFAVKDFEEWLEFESNTSYRNYIRNLGFEIKYYPEDISFFDKKEMSLLRRVGGKPYSSNNSQDKINGELIRPLFYKTNVWARLSLIQNFTYSKDLRWKWIKKFKAYSWIKIYRENQSFKDVFFTVGVDGPSKSLVCKLDCQRDKISAGDQLLFDNHISGTGASWHTFDYVNSILGWRGLIQQTKKFIETYSLLYDEVVELLVTGENIVADQNKLVLSNVPEEIKSFLKGRERTFSPSSTDWERETKKNTVIGESGESLIINYEKERLSGHLTKGLLDRIEKVKDGSGYDVISFDEAGSEIYIEVKTTTGDKNMPFYMSANEIAFMKSKKSKYYIYRVCNYSQGLNSGTLFILNGVDLLDRLHFEATNFEVSLKQE